MTVFCIINAIGEKDPKVNVHFDFPRNSDIILIAISKDSSSNAIVATTIFLFYFMINRQLQGLIIVDNAYTEKRLPVIVTFTQGYLGWTVYII